MRRQPTAEQSLGIYADPKVNFKVLAVPGSGKSTLLVNRVGYLLSLGYSTDHILVIMFNDSACINFSKDLQDLELMNLPEVKTFHSYARKLGYILTKRGLMDEPNFQPSKYEYHRFYKESLQLYIPQHLHNVIAIKSAETTNDFCRFVELCKSSLLAPEEVFKQFSFPLDRLCYIDCFVKSEDLRKSRNIQFFSDLIYDLIMVCRENPNALSAVSNKHKVVLVDEYQDANAATHELIKLIAGNKAAVNVVGDDDQTIYDFTGASPIFIKSRFDEDFADVKTYPLTKTFRYGHSVCLMSNNLIFNNEFRIEKLCVSGVPDLITHIGIVNYKPNGIDIEQASLIKEISDYLLGGGRPSDIAILVREYSSTFGIEIALLKHGIPYFISKEAKSVLHSDHSLFFLNCLTALSDSFEENVRLLALTNFLTAYFWLDSKVDLSNVGRCMLAKDVDGAIKGFSGLSNQFKPDVASNIARRIKAFVKVLKSKKETTGYRLPRLVDECGIPGIVAKKYWRTKADAMRKFESISDLFQSMHDDPHLAVTTINRLKEVIENSEKGSGVEFCTLHKSKGLAWPFVIMAYCEEGICPSYNSSNNPYLVEVERRLFYVGVTRVRKKLILHIPLDLNLSQNLKDFKGYITDSDKYQKGIASRFVYETNLISAVKIATEIHQKVNQSSITSTGNRHIYNQYLHAVGMNYRISGLKDTI